MFALPLSLSPYLRKQTFRGVSRVTAAPCYRRGGLVADRILSGSASSYDCRVVPVSYSRALRDDEQTCRRLKLVTAHSHHFSKPPNVYLLKTKEYIEGNDEFLVKDASSATDRGTTVETTRATRATTAAKRSIPTDAPMLNYIFDVHSTLNKHQHHHDHRWGPHFEGESTNVTVQAGATVMLDCKILLLQKKTVSTRARPT